MKKTLILLCAIILSVTLRAQYDARSIQLENRIYEEGIRSVTLSTGHLQDHPVITLSTGELYLDFDDLVETSRYVKYTLIHCTRSEEAHV